jgi:hypothetical protein
MIRAGGAYKIADVLVDGISVGAIDTYTFASVNADHTISANFVVKTFKITSSAKNKKGAGASGTPAQGAGGTITPPGTLSVEYGSSQDFTITPDAGYLIEEVTVDDVSVGAPTGYTFSNVTADHTITATFAPLTVDRLVCPAGCQYESLQAAIDASSDGDTIKLAEGVYRENVTIAISRDIFIQGGWDDTFSSRMSDPFLTIIDGDMNADGIGDGSVIALNAGAGINIRATIENLMLINGYADKGGAVQVLANSGSAELTLLRNVLTGNSAASGGGISAQAVQAGNADLVLEGNIIARNSATNGAGLDLYAADSGSTVTISSVNNTITENRASEGGGLRAASELSGNVSMTALNEIIWGNTAHGISSDISLYQNASSTTMSVISSDIGSVFNGPANGGTYTDDAGTFNADPVFMNPSLVDYRLHKDSPCIDTGTMPGLSSVDMLGQVRPLGTGIDMGAIEYVDAPPSALELSSLNGGEVIDSGMTYTITWSKPDSLPAQSYAVFYSLNNGVSWKKASSANPEVTGNIVNGRTHFNWKVPELTKNKKRCRIKINSYSGLNATGPKVGTDRSARTFMVEVIRVLSPRGGGEPQQTLKSGTTATISWVMTDKPKLPVTGVALYYTKDGGSTWESMTHASHRQVILSENTGMYEWIIPSLGSQEKKKCKVRVDLYGMSGDTPVKIGSDTSESFFAITP